MAVLSLEREDDLRDTRRVDALRRELAEAGIADWMALRYRTPGARNVATNVADATAVALDFVADESVSLIHARSYLGGMVANAVRKALGTPYLFDMRGYWVDERIEDGRWFTHPIAESGARRIERALFRAHKPA